MHTNFNSNRSRARREREGGSGEAQQRKNKITNHEVISIGSGKHKRIDFTFAQRLEQIMIERDLNQSELSKVVCIRRQRIEEYVSGRHQPSIYALKKIALALHVSADFLLGIENMHD